MLRRYLAVEICVSLALATVLPLPACAMLAGLPGVCGEAAASAREQNHCEQVPAVPSRESLDARADMACCELRGAPSADSLAAPNGITQPEISAGELCSGDALPVPSRPAESARAASTPFFSPPDLQPLFCVFLI